ncbi:related to PMS1 - DNA mismatch repair protein [Melanopsichium pennsylvanicum]|uniref:DNA mismatch repair protein PMS1 n=2 Tax=Melanopsichium pennsylvanicum TaxID=63383 RepID=A0AAJ5C3S9_9BASI|nr:related to PMS1-DNA mismatch repair protein [Melanopsichium pennsylvanicum 4]SNX82907.1 related to PMS1 - DNA mismatch repair protein [Melanopsichium pennsylvanicum]
MSTTDLPQKGYGAQPLPSTGSNVIKPIPLPDVHRITSGQVVLDLQTAVKELIENALDASATNIAINFRDYGADSFEVIDNGTGLDPSNYACVGLKHYTSKLSSFSDLALVRTFGFRGEALSSLCALASVTIHTATKEQAPMGTVLKLDRGGRVESDTGRAARQRGTTITIEGLFKTLPVRRKEFEKNFKREFTKAQNLLQAYALITKGVRWTTTNTPAGGRKQAQFSVNSSNADDYLVANVSALFGAKVAPTLMPLHLDLTFSVARTRNKYLQSIADANSANDDAEAAQNETSTVTVIGLISKPTYGSGRTSSDRQFFYINGRPWEAGRVSRAFNEVYKSYISNHFPFVIADFRLPTDSYDVNVSPDKRTIFLHEESRLIEKVREALEELFAPSRATFMVNGASRSLRNGNGVTSLSAQSKLDGFAARANDQRAVDAGQDESEEDQTDREDELELGEQEAEVRHKEGADLEPELKEQSMAGNKEDQEGSDPSIRALEAKSHDLEYREDSDSLPPLAVGGRGQQIDDDSDSNLDAPGPLAPESQSPIQPPCKRDFDEVLDVSQASWSPTKKQRTKISSPAPTRSIKSPVTDRSRREARNVLSSLRTYALPGTQIDEDLPVSRRMAAGDDEDVTTLMAAEVDVVDEFAENRQEILPPPVARVDEDRSEDEALSVNEEPLSNKLIAMKECALVSDHGEILSLDLASLAHRLQSRRAAAVRAATKAPPSLTVSGQEALLADASVSNEDEASVERALSRVIHKSDFALMSVVGQFNLGFIIARRHVSATSTCDEMDDLFIVDQHASDEKFNFETLHHTTVIRSQKLISPRPLELSGSDELVAIEHQETLLSNGFEIEVSETGLPGTRIKLISQPMSKGVVFGVKDLEELLYLLRDTSAGSDSAKGQRCGKARNMFASRACRKSVMIGTALNKMRMKGILKNMGEIEHPWNCPHGRPTMRHLACLKTHSGKVTRVEMEQENVELSRKEVARRFG